MKRRSLTFFILVVFLVWNVMTYLFLAYRPQGKPVSGQNNQNNKEVSDFEAQLALLDQEIKNQLRSNEKLLNELQEYRAMLINLVPEERRGQLASIAGDKSGLAQFRPPPNLDPSKAVIPVLVIACNRVTINRNLDQLIKYRTSKDRFPIIVSQDCGHQPTANVIRGYGDQVIHIQHPDLSDIKLAKKENKFKGYFKIARHYKWALNQIFQHFEAVIIVEDDLDISPDFFEYFAATYPILKMDPTLWCVSAWNDNGKSGMVSNEPELLYRTDFFPGLGWMLEKSTWVDLEDTWPKTFWDDWMRHPDQRKDRACIRPEISRTSTFGKIGVSKGQFFEKHLKFIKLNSEFVPFTQRDLSYLSKENYDELFVKKVYSVPLLSIHEALRGNQPGEAVRVQYNDKLGYKAMAKQLGLMEDLKSGVPRAGYRGVVSFIHKGRRLYFAPPADWKQYDPTWS